MANLIYRDELIKEIRSTPNFGKEWDKALCEAIVKDAPTVDAVEVVRCKDCKYYDNHIGDCMECAHLVGDDDYCSFGERKEGEHDDKA